MKELFKFKVKSGDTMAEFGIVEASKAVSREGEMVYAKTYASCVRNDLLTNAEAAKLSKERGGVLTKDEEDDYAKTFMEYAVKQKDLDSKPAGEEVGVLTDEVKALKDKILAYQNKNDTIFEFTAESKARDAVLLHYALALVVKSDGKPYFEGRDNAARNLSYENSKDPIKDEVLKRAVWYSTALTYGITDLNLALYPGDAQDTVPTNPA